MSYLRAVVAIQAVCVAMLLSACGGGGGGDVAADNSSGAGQSGSPSGSGPGAATGKVLYLSVDELNDQLRIFLAPGANLTDPHVTIGIVDALGASVELPVDSTRSTSSMLVTHIDRTGPNSLGYVRVYQGPLNFITNPPILYASAKLYAWSGTVSATQYGTTATQVVEAHFPVRFRSSLDTIKAGLKVDEGAGDDPRSDFTVTSGRNSDVSWSANGTVGGITWERARIPPPAWEPLPAIVNNGASHFGAYLRFAYAPLPSPFPGLSVEVVVGFFAAQGLAIGPPFTTHDIFIGTSIPSRSEVFALQIREGHDGDGFSSALVVWSDLACENPPP